jgi:hypothetical protein
MRDPDLVTALDISSYASCPESWRLGEVLGLRPGKEASLARGERIHAKTAAAEKIRAHHRKVDEEIPVRQPAVRSGDSLRLDGFELS